MKYQGNILKMKTEQGSPINYELPLGDQLVPMNQLIGKKIHLQFDGRINCISCGKQIKKTFGQGFCYSCFQTVPEADESIVRPELSMGQWGIARDLEWAQKHDLIPHYVYLAVSANLKVGVTRYHQIPTRWIDQGASFAMQIAKTPNRHIAGVIEVFLKQYYKDKTNWRHMLQNQIDDQIDLIAEREKVNSLLPDELKQYICWDTTPMQLNYPVLEYPKKISSLSFDKNHSIEGILNGIKGQYLLFDEGRVLNIRKHNGYYISLETA